MSREVKRVILTRKIGEKIFVTHEGEAFAIILTEVRGRNQVRITLEAPPSFLFTRGELMEREPASEGELV